MSPATDLEEALTVIAPGDPLPAGTRLRDYEITGLLREGGFAIVYLAWDHALQRRVALKEYMPASMASRADQGPAVELRDSRNADTFAIGLKSFLEEARLLARFDHASLVKVYRFWEDNDTAYMAMPFYEGPTLERALAELGRVPGETELRAWLKPVLNALTVLHDAGVWHQNVGPEEIVLTPTGPVLLGLASAGHAIEAVQRAPAAALKRGYAAIEQYGSVAGAMLGPWTDLYALAAVVYGAVTGQAPAPAPDRLVADGVPPLGQIAAGLYGAPFLAAIDAALKVQPSGRPASHQQFRALMGDIDAPEAPVSLTPRLDLMQEPFLGAASGPREITVPDRPLLVPTRPDPMPVAEAPPPTASAAQTAGASEAAGTPTWMGGLEEAGSGKRSLWSAALLALVLIVGAALGLHAWLRPGERGSAGVAAASSGTPAKAVAAPASAAAATVPSGPAASTVAASSPRGVASAPATPPITAGLGASAVGPTSALPAPAAGSAAPPATAAVPVERQARCIDILQRASLERISPADADFFKKECK